MDSEATRGLNTLSGGLDQGRYGSANAREMVARVWILRQQED